MENTRFWKCSDLVSHFPAFALDACGGMSADDFSDEHEAGSVPSQDSSGTCDAGSGSCSSEDEGVGRHERLLHPMGRGGSGVRVTGTLSPDSGAGVWSRAFTDKEQVHIPRDVLATVRWQASRRLGKIVNLWNTCFVNPTVQVLARVEGFARCLFGHSHPREPSEACVLDQVEALHEGQRVERSEVALLARAGRSGEEFRGDASTGGGRQCDASEFLFACLGALTRHGEDRLRSELRDWSPEQLRRLTERGAVSEHVCGSVFRSRKRCAQCSAVHDVLLPHPIVVLDMKNNVYTSRQDLWQHRMRKHRGEQQRCPVGCGANGYKQEFLGREPPVMILILIRFCQKWVGGEIRYPKECRKVDFPEVLDRMRSGE